MRNPIAFLVIGLFFGTGIGFLWAASQGITLDGHDHTQHPANAPLAGHDMPGHDHSKMAAVSFEDDGTAPALSAILHEDTVGGWNLELQTTNFTFSPQTVNQADIPNTGHAHIYVDGAKLARVYGPWFHIASLPKGDHTVAVELNTNSHSPMDVGGKPVRVELKVTAP